MDDGERSSGFGFFGDEERKHSHVCLVLATVRVVIDGAVCLNCWEHPVEKRTYEERSTNKCSKTVVNKGCKSGTAGVFPWSSFGI